MFSLLNPLVYSPLLLLFSLLFLSKWLFASKSKGSIPPSPPKLPFIGNLHQLGFLPHRNLRKLAHKYGPLMLLHFGSRPALIVSSIEGARDIMKTNDLKFSNRPTKSFGHKLFYDTKDVAFATYGEHWRQLKSIVVMQLLTNKRVQSFHNVREEEAAYMISKIEKQRCSSPSAPVNLSEMFIELTNDVICRIAYGRKYTGREGVRKFKYVLGELVEVLGAFNVADYIPWLGWINRLNGLDAKVEKVGRELDAIMEGVVEEHIERYKREESGGVKEERDIGQQDLVDVLLEIQKDNADKYTLHRDSIKGVVLDMFLAGTDTTFTALEWTMTELIRHPKALKKLQDEVRAVGGGKPLLTEDDVQKMPYLKAVMKEAIRLHPPAPLLIRQSTKDANVLGYDIAAGTQAFINNWAIARDPTLWENPDEFEPERFFKTSINFYGHDFELLPFGSGRRSCPGILFATTVNELGLASVVYRYDFTLPGGIRGEDIDMSEVPGLSNPRKYPLLVFPKPYYTF
ncbi:cytochrome P450 736A117-like [Cornus florida]|uniref:cytochrome P450 736A117-like n=1 Tax=Cornus florida TaxID=4283 RepID=UPI00289E052F|nr:cytochrome P450 736A117-like [Cornus florida]